MKVRKKYKCSILICTFSLTTILFFIMLRGNIPPGLSLFQSLLNNHNTDFSALFS